MPNINKDRVALILIDAIALGDRSAADKWQVTARTVQRYRASMLTDPALSAFVAEKVKAENANWAEVRLRFLRKAIGKLDVLVEAATVDHIHQVAGAIKIVGDLHVVVGALGADVESVAHRKGSIAPQIAGGIDPQDRSATGNNAH